jgi:predicted nucleotidyltransferase component of viral defense system
VQLSPLRAALTNPYGPPFTVTCMALEEILAEKIRAALMRRAPRDYFDLWLLFQREDIVFAVLPDLIQAKLDTVGSSLRAPASLGRAGHFAAGVERRPASVDARCATV